LVATGAFANPFGGFVTARTAEKRGFKLGHASKVLPNIDLIFAKNAKMRCGRPRF
jgi:hypothetical protein